MEERAHRDDQAARSAAAVRASGQIRKRWNLTADQAARLLGMSRSRFLELVKRPESAVLKQDQETRAALLISIYKNLRILFGDTVAHQWVTTRNNHSMFGGGTPLEFMEARGIPGMEAVKRLLDGRRGGRS